MKIFFQASTRHFFTDEIHSPEQIPKDTVEISKETHAAMFEGQAIGHVISAGEDGHPVLAERPPKTDEEKMENLRAQRVPLLEKTDEIALRCFKAGKPYPSEWNTYTTALLDLPSKVDVDDPKFPTAPAIPSGV